VDEYGMVDVNDVEKAILPETILITIMHANNEVGTIQPIGEISELARKRGIVFHTDAAQSVGKINTDVGELGVDLMSVAGHKLYAPKGIGALFLRHGISIEKFVHGANHEGNKRAGTENVLEIVGLGKACELAKKELSDRNRHMREMRDRLWDGLKRNLKDLKLNGHPEKRLPNTLNLSFQDIEANKMISEMENLAVSAGAACHSETINISHVLTAMNVPVNYAVGTLRFSTGKMTRKDEIDEAVEIVTDVVRRLKRLKDTT
jgi:cysteine desulfurase